jgi:hypothetical protein
MQRRGCNAMPADDSLFDEERTLLDETIAALARQGFSITLEQGIREQSYCDECSIMYDGPDGIEAITLQHIDGVSTVTEIAERKDARGIQQASTLLAHLPYLVRRLRSAGGTAYADRVEEFYRRRVN